MKISTSGQKHIQRFEDLRINAYPGSNGLWHIGYGSTHWLDGRRVKEGDKLKNQQEALDLLEYSLRSPVRYINTHVNVFLTQNQFDILVSLAYNVKGINLKKSGILEALNDRNYDYAAMLITSDFLCDPKISKHTAGCRKPDQLIARRNREQEIFMML
ncbi:lysozyme [Sphingobacterium spiritivorum]|uniref:lysozyme n=1 Tax=Sphingobacterium spiritivorum TaxID=258 RepID=UPI003DA51A6A